MGGGVSQHALQVHPEECRYRYWESIEAEQMMAGESSAAGGGAGRTPFHPVEPSSINYEDDWVSGDALSDHYEDEVRSSRAESSPSSMTSSTRPAAVNPGISLRV